MSELREGETLRNRLMGVADELGVIQEKLAVLDDFLVRHADESSDGEFFEKRRASGRAEMSGDLLHRLDEAAEEILEIRRGLGDDALRSEGESDSGR